MTTNYIDLIDSDSDEGDSILNSTVATRPRRSKKISSSSSLEEEEEWKCEDDSDFSDDNDETVQYTSSLRQRLSRRQKSKRTRGARKPLVDEDNEEKDEEEGSDLKMPATNILNCSKDDENDEHKNDKDGDQEDQMQYDNANLKVSAVTSTSSSSSSSSSQSKSKSKSNNNDSSAGTSNSDPESAKKFIKLLQDGVKKRTFPLSQIPTQEQISTGRTIKPLKAWKGHWPPLREFLQNTIDHLHLMDGVTGRRQGCIQMNVATPKKEKAKKTKKNNDDCEYDYDLASISFTCNGEDICKINISTDRVVIDQLYTYPIASRALDTGVPDVTKSSSNSQAGGFGDGFKTAAVALIANSTKKNEFQSLKWSFYAMKEHTAIEWDFVGSTREKVATFDKCQVLQVNINKRTMKPSEELQVLKNHNYSEASASKGRGCSGYDYIMRQTIVVKGIGKSFLNEAIPRLIVFWDLNELSMLSMRSRSTRICGGDFIAPINLQPPLFNGFLGNSLKIRGGVYVKGIYVRPTKIKDTIMAFFGDRLEVCGRDRNEIDEDELIHAVTQLIGRCSNIGYLNELLLPLRGEQSEENDDASQSSKRRKRTTINNSANGTKSWLLQSPRFFNRVIEIQKDFIIHTVFQIPKGALFVSKKTTDSKDPFISWAASFLEKHGAPLIPIAKGANRFLFEEVDRYELTEKCVSILKQLEKDRRNTKGKSNQTQTIFRKLFTFMGIARAKIFFSPEIVVAFVHENSIWIPESSISRDIIVKVLNVCHSQLEGSNGENYSCLLQSIFEKVPPTSRDFDSELSTLVIDRAKEVLKEQRDFLVNATKDKVSHSNKVSRSAAKLDEVSHSVISIDSDDDETEKITNSSASSSEQRKPSRNEHLVPTTLANLEDQIKNVTKAVTSKKRTQNGGSKANPIIPASLFEDDNAGNDSCMRPSSSLVKVNASTVFGGGSIWFDKISAEQIKSGKFNKQHQTKIALLRNVLDEAKRMVVSSIPSTSVLLERVMVGYDSKNDTYEAFCDGHQIIVNLFSYMPKLTSLSPSLSSHRTLIHDFVIMVTHELAHFLEPHAGHGPVWRDTHMKMMLGVMKHLEGSK